MDLRRIIHEVDNIVFFGGAGVSTESGIPDFRSPSGIYACKDIYGVVPERILSHEYFWSDTERFYDFYRNSMIYEDAQPNDAHIALARLEKQGKLKAVITQNIDGLHQMAGSENVLELHGSIQRNYCVTCGTFHNLAHVVSSKGIPKCKSCGGMVKPDVVLYGEPVDEVVTRKSIQAIQAAEVLIIGGTSLSVYPAAGFIKYFKGKSLILINKGVTAYDDEVDLLIRDSIGKVLKEAVGGKPS